MRKPRFLVQVRFDGETHWRTYRFPETVLVAIAIAKKLVDVRFSEPTNDHNQAIRFDSRDQADLVMMTIRQLRGDLFPSCLTRVPCAVEHMWIPGQGVKAVRQ